MSWAIVRIVKSMKGAGVATDFEGLGEHTISFKPHPSIALKAGLPVQCAENSPSCHPAQDIWYLLLPLEIWGEDHRISRAGHDPPRPHLGFPVYTFSSFPGCHDWSTGSLVYRASSLIVQYNPTCRLDILIIRSHVSCHALGVHVQQASCTILTVPDACIRVYALTI